MKLFVANTTKQRHVFAFRMLESGKLRQIPIEHGSQMMVLDGSTDEINSVIQHHQVYGMVDSTKIDQSSEFVGICYSIDKPVGASVIEKTIRDNDEKLNSEAHMLRQASLAALDKTLSEGGTGYNGEMEFSVEQAKGRDESDDAVTVNETIATEKSRSKKK